MQRFFRQPTLIILFCLAVAAILFATPYLPSRLGWLHPAEVLERAELYSVDQRFVIRGPRTPRSDIAIIGIDKLSLDEDDTWPWPRDKHARLIRRLLDAGAAVVAFDVLFDKPRPPRDKAERLGVEDAKLARAIADSGRVVMACHYEATMAGGNRAEEGARKVTQLASMDALKALDAVRERMPPLPDPAPTWLPPTIDTFWTLPLPEFVEGRRTVKTRRGLVQVAVPRAGIGFINTPRDPDTIFRRARLVEGVNNGTLFPNLSLAVVARVLGVPVKEVRVTERTLQVGSKLVIPLDADGTVPIDFAGGPMAFPRYSYAQVLRMPSNELREEFRGKILFIGATAMTLYDLRPTPYEKGSEGQDGTNLGVYIHANLTDALLQQRFFHRPGWLATLMILLMIAAYLGRVLAVYPMWEAIGAAALLFAAYTLFCVASFQGMFRGMPVLFPMAVPLLSIALDVSVVMTYRFRTEYNERKRHREYLERFVSPQVAAQLVEHPETSKLGWGGRREVTILFSDIRGFTSMSERMEPGAVATMLCGYFEEMVAIVMRQEGELNNFIGDALVVVWNSHMHRPQPDHARRAVLTALEMLSAWEKLQEEWQAAGHPTFRIGIGINTGPVFWGNIGTEKRTQMTMIGDAVNAAARFEALNKEMGTSLLIGQPTYEPVADLVEVRPLPPVKVKGKSEPLQVYEVLAPKETAPATVAVPKPVRPRWKLQHPLATLARGTGNRRGHQRGID